jgi:hypothetical protein
LSPYLLNVLVFVPLVIVGLLIRAYAWRHGRELSWFGFLKYRSAPFIDERLNEAYCALRKYGLIGLFVLVTFAGVAAIITNSDAVFVCIGSVAVLSGFASSLFVEASIAFGAETAPAHESAPQSLAT